MQRNWVVLGAVVLLVAIAGCSGITGDDGGSGTPDWCGTGQVSAEQFQAGGGEVDVSVNGIVERNGEEQCQITYDLSDAQMSTYSTVELYFNEDFSTYEGVYYDQNGNEVASFDMAGMGAGASTGDSDGMFGDTGGTVTTSTSGGDDGVFGDSGGDDGATAATGGSDTGGNDDVARIEGSLTYGDTITGELTDGDGVAGEWREANADAYTFQGSSGDRVTVEMESGPVDTYLYLEGPDGDLVERDDDGGSGLDSELTTTLSQTGTYTIWATTFTRSSFGGTGEYSLSLSEASPAENAGTAQVEGSITYGQTITGELTASDGSASPWRDAQADAYAFQGSAGDSVTIDMQSNPVDTYLILVGPDGELVAENDDGGQGFDSQITTTLPESGTYAIYASTFTLREWGEISGEYTLSVQ